MNKKGFIFSMDFLLAIAILITVLLVLHLEQASILDQIRQQERSLMHETLLSTTDNLILFPGYPSDWDADSVIALGFADTPSVLNSTKVEQFVNIDYEQAKTLLGLKDFYFEIRNETTVLYATGSHFEDVANVFSVKRQVVLDGQIVELRLITW